MINIFPSFCNVKQKKTMQRLYYLDHLKVCLTVLVIMHHAGQAYGDGGGWAYTPSNPAEFMPWIWHFFSTNAAFFMGLFFLISGYFVPASYDKQGALANSSSSESSLPSFPSY
jgi:peptidoglycan/LPS O-acetylase OafA/YrhL